jgi:HSP20 family molecular chaperone IbpA
MYQSIFQDPFLDHFFGRLDKNVSYDKTGANIQIIAPGYGKKDVSVTYDSSLLKIKFKKFSKSEDEAYERVFKLDPTKFDVDSISAKIEDGILVVKVPNLKREASEKVITVE